MKIRHNKQGRFQPQCQGPNIILKQKFLYKEIYFSKNRKTTLKGKD